MERNVSPPGYGAAAGPAIQLTEMAEQVQPLTEAVQRLREGQEFDRRLLEAKDRTPATSAQP